MMKRTVSLVAVAVLVLAAAVVWWLARGASDDDAQVRAEEEQPPARTFSHAGRRLIEVEETLEAADSVWRRLRLDWGDTYSVPEDSRCYLMEKRGEVTLEGVCGPVRTPLSKGPEWVKIPWFYATVLESELTFGAGMIDGGPCERDCPSGKLLRADGSGWDRRQIVDPPAGWPKTLKPGRVDEPSQWTDGEVVASEPVRLVGHDYVVDVVTLKRIVYSDFSTYVRAKGGGLVDFRIAPADPADVEALNALKVLIGPEQPGQTDRDRIVFEVKSGSKTLTQVYTKPFLAPGSVSPRMIEGSPALHPAMIALPDLDGASYALEFAGSRYPVS